MEHWDNRSSKETTVNMKANACSTSMSWTLETGSQRTSDVFYVFLAYRVPVERGSMYLKFRFGRFFWENKMYSSIIWPARFPLNGCGPVWILFWLITLLQTAYSAVFIPLAIEFQHGFWFTALMLGSWIGLNSEYNISKTFCEKQNVFRHWLKITILNSIHINPEIKVGYSMTSTIFI